jgi:hypothetical protein
MSNMDASQREQMDRPDLLSSRGSRLLQATPGEQRALNILTPIFILILGALVFAAAQVFDGWPDAIVIADIIIVVLGLAYWAWPGRRNI